MGPLVPIGLALAKEFLPALVSKITGPKGGKVAEIVVDSALTATGASTPEAAIEVLRADAKLAQEYRLAVLNHEVVMEQLGIEDRKREDVDRNDARQRDIEIRRLGKDNARADRMVALATWGLVGSIAALCTLAYLKARYPDAVSDAVFGALVAQFSTIGSYFGLSLRDAFTFEFGSSRGSRDKDALLAERARE